VERVLDFMGDAGRQLTERGHLLGLDQARLRRLQITERRLRHVACFADLLLGTLSDSYVAVDHDKPASGYRVVSHFENAAVGSRALVAVMPARIFGKAAQLGLGVDCGAKLTAYRQKADKICQGARLT